MDDDKDYFEVVGRVSKRDRDGNDVTDLSLDSGGFRRADGTLANLAYNLRRREDDDDDDDYDYSWDSDGEDDDDDDDGYSWDFDDVGFGVGAAIAGLALIGVTAAAVGAAVSASHSRKQELREAERRREEERKRLEARAATAQRSKSRRRIAAPPGWYYTEPGLMRWWDGEAWTDHCRSDPRRVPAPPGWYDDGSGRQRWWDGGMWTDYFRSTDPVQAELAAGRGTSRGSSTEMVTSSRRPRVTMSSDEWKERVRAMMVAAAFSEEQWNLLSNARIENGDPSVLEWQSELSKLTAHEFLERINYMLENNSAARRMVVKAPAARWYDAGSGRRRWWNGSYWE
ncbi:MAG TPA: DUF2510 domain-containing protein [Actinomycetaceae bacterium]|nr:DUF2510 domain-containing protein [Actinomycetaceae bacterium]